MAFNNDVEASTEQQKDHPAHARSHSVVIRNAKAATDKEHKMSLLQGIKLYPKAVGWSMLISLCIAMEGFDLCLLGTFYAIPQFNKQFGEQLPDGSYQVTAAWQSGLSNGAVVGEIIGLSINGYVSERFGYRYTVLACLAMITGFIAIFFTATKVEQLQVQKSCAVCLGVSSKLSPSPMLLKSALSP